MNAAVRRSGLQPELQLAVAAGDAGERGLGHPHHLGGLQLARSARPLEAEHGLRARRGVGGGGEGLADVVERRAAGAVLRACELQEQRRAIAVGRRLGERARQQRDRLGRGARGERTPAGLGERRGARGIARGLRPQEVDRDDLVVRPADPQQLRGLAVEAGALAGGQRAEHRVADERVRELERPRVAQDAGAREPLGVRGRLRRLHPGQARGGGQRRGLQHRDRAGEPLWAVAEPRDRRADRARQRLRPHARDERRGVAAIVAQALGEPADQQRVAAGRRVAGGGQPVQARAVALGQQRLGPGERERRRLQQRGGRRRRGHAGALRRDAARPGARRCGWRGRRGSGSTPRPPSAGRRRRAAAAASAARLATSQKRPCSAPKAASASAAAPARSGRSTGAASAAAPPSARSRAASDIPRSRGSSSCRATPQAYAVSSSLPRAAATARPRSGAASRTALEQARLADARRPLDEDGAAAPGDRVAERRVECRELGIALVQPQHHRCGRL